MFPGFFSGRRGYGNPGWENPSRLEAEEIDSYMDKLRKAVNHKMLDDPELKVILVKDKGQYHR